MPRFYMSLRAMIDVVEDLDGVGKSVELVEVEPFFSIDTFIPTPPYSRNYCDPC